MSFQQLKIHKILLKGIQACGFDSPTEIQSKAVPVALEGCDLIATAQTGTGKTAAFVIPALQMLLVRTPEQRQIKKPSVLILTPTRELANQVTDNLKQIGRFMRLRYANIVGGLPYPPQIRLLSQALEIIVATPGRLIDHINNGRVDLTGIRILVLDEADRMLDMGFINDVVSIAEKTPATRQTLLFSATFEKDVREIAKKLQKQPIKIELTHAAKKHADIDQCALQADNYRHKHALLRFILNNHDMEQAVVFTSTKRSAERLSNELKDRGFKTVVLHGDMKQAARKRTIELMKKKYARILVATDVAARGIDIRSISHVVNFDLPAVAEDYVHRIGRTGRAGNTGVAVSLVGPNDWSYLSDIEKLTGSKIPQTVISGLEPRSSKPSMHGKKPDPGKLKRRHAVISHKRSTNKPSVAKAPSSIKERIHSNDNKSR